MFRALYARLVARPALVVLIAVATAIPMGFWSVRLFQNVRADLKELLPANAPSVKALNLLEKRFGGFSQLSILVESPDSAANRRFTDDLVAAMSKSPAVRSIRNKLGSDKEFFAERRHLFVELDDLETILERIEDAANDARARANPLLVDLEDKGPVELDLSDIEKKYEGKFSLVKRFPEDYFESPDKKALAVILRKHGLAFSLDSNLALVADVGAAIEKLDPQKYHPELTVMLGGDVKNVIQEHESLIEDLALASVIVAVLLSLVIVLYYRRFRALYLLAIPVLIGCAWTFGISYFLIGYLNASSAFLGPIIPGNGMNFGLILLARYIEERRQGRSIDEGAECAVRYTMKATALVAIAAAIAYGSLIATDFLGFKHFGIIGGLGMLICWLATFVVMPPLLIWIERVFPLEPNKELKFVKPGVLAALPARVIAKAPGAIAIAGIVSGIASAVLTVQYLADPFEKDFNKLRSRVALESGSAVVSKKVDEIFGLYQDPQVIVADRDEDVPLIVAALEEKIKSGGEMGPLAEVTALTTLIPKDQEAKLEVLAKIRKVLSDDLLSNLEPEQRKLAEAHRPPGDLKAFAVPDLPATVRADFRELDGREGRVVLALPNMKLNLYHADEIQRVADALRSIRLPNGSTVESSGSFVIYSDMIAAIAEDGPRATIYSFLGVLLLSIVAYRRLRHVAVVSSALLIGVAWLGAILQLFSIKINFLNFIALPITFGIGVDYAVNIYTRYRLERETKGPVEAAFDTVASTGGAVVLCSLTTVIGYASLLVARNGALISFGKIAIIGEFACLAAALFLMPAWLMAWADRKRD